MEDDEERQRRVRLHELDGLLDGLERLNLSDAKEMPEALRDGLVKFDIEVPAKPNFTALIEQVWELQEKFLSPGMGVDSATSALNRSPESH